MADLSTKKKKPLQNDSLRNFSSSTNKTIRKKNSPNEISGSDMLRDRIKLLLLFECLQREIFLTIKLCHHLHGKFFSWIFERKKKAE
jgi:hypothetical protein